MAGAADAGVVDPGWLVPGELAGDAAGVVVAAGALAAGVDVVSVPVVPVVISSAMTWAVLEESAIACYRKSKGKPARSSRSICMNCRFHDLPRPGKPVY